MSVSLLAVVLLVAMVWDHVETVYAAATNLAQRNDAAPAAVVLSSGSSAAGDAELILLIDLDESAEACPLAGSAVISRLDVLAGVSEDGSADAMRSERNISANSGGAGGALADFARQHMPSQFTSLYRSIRKFAAILGLRRIQEEAALSGTTIIGTISTYNPNRDGKEEGGVLTASGELYDPSAWTAAIQTGLRDQFGGVRYGRLYQPTYALVTSGEKRLIVRINDVGPLKAGRVLDLNERSMRFFDPLLTQGLIQDAKITLLPGEEWTPGPVDVHYAIDFAAATEKRAAAAATEDAELDGMRARFDLSPETERVDVRTAAAPSGG
ncbi:MAG TPA: septal ring lytic transglycosylase RlpA family protein [Pseudolabrys sp.]|nr:septal ring lytic transglycosylase RlpA family protein [Pseudolabrys sp.]